MRKRRPEGVFVIGMHRSGTSAAVLALESLGFNICIDSDRMKSTHGNPDHGESVAVVAENDAILARYESSWHHPRLGHKWLSDTEVVARSLAGRSMFREVHPIRPWACKDPRLCLTLPYWDAIVGSKMPVLLIVRNPLEVADSLRRRERAIDTHHTKQHYLDLWEHYMRSALVNLRDRPVFCLSYEDDLLDDKQAWVVELRKWLNSEGFKAGSEKAWPINKSLRHNFSEGSTAGLSEEQLALYRTLINARGHHHRFQVVPPEVESLSALKVFGPMVAVGSSGFIRIPALAFMRRRLHQISSKNATERLIPELVWILALTLAASALMVFQRLNYTQWLDSLVVTAGWPAKGGLTLFSNYLTSGRVIVALALLFCIILIVAKKRLAAALVIFALIGSAIIERLFAGSYEASMGTFDTTGFMTVTMFGMISYFTWQFVGQKIARVAVVIAASLLTILIMMNGAYVESGYFSVALASELFGLALMVTLIAVYEALKQPAAETSTKAARAPKADARLKALGKTGT